jgi:hypothetical protein
LHAAGVAGPSGLFGSLPSRRLGARSGVAGSSRLPVSGVELPLEAQPLTVPLGLPADSLVLR